MPKRAYWSLCHYETWGVNGPERDKREADLKAPEGRRAPDISPIGNLLTEVDRKVLMCYTCEA